MRGSVPLDRQQNARWVGAVCPNGQQMKQRRELVDGRAHYFDNLLACWLNHFRLGVSNQRHDRAETSTTLAK